MVRGPCSLTISKMTLEIVCVCSGGVLSSIGFIGGFGFFAKYLIAVPKTILVLTLHSLTPRRPGWVVGSGQRVLGGSP